MQAPHILRGNRQFMRRTCGVFGKKCSPCINMRTLPDYALNHAITLSRFSGGTDLLLVLSLYQLLKEKAGYLAAKCFSIFTSQLLILVLGIRFFWKVAACCCPYESSGIAPKL